jgi:hypothetical protein
MALSEVIAAIETTPARLAAVAAGLEPGRRRRRPRPGDWCVNEVMGHLLHVETVAFLPRLRRMLTEEWPTFERFSPEPWARERDHSLDDFDATLAAFQQARGATLAFLRALPAGAGDRPGLSAFFGPVTLAQYATHVVEHDLEHLAQMAECRRLALNV